MKKSIDWQLGVELANGNEDTAEILLEMMRDQLPEFKQLLTESFIAKDVKNFISHVHKLHGGCCYCGVPQLKQLVRSLEVQAKEEPPIMDPELFKETLAEIDRVIEGLALKDYK